MGGANSAIIAVERLIIVADTRPIDYPHIHKLYSWATSPKGGGWFIVPTNVFAGLCLAAGVLYLFIHHWAFIAVAFLCFGAWEKRMGMKEGFVLGYETGHDEAVAGKKDFTNP